MSRGSIGAPHEGHRDRGRTTDSPRGSRWTATVMKLPTTSPKGSATSARSQASSTGPTLSTADPPAWEAGGPQSWMYEMSCLNPVTPVIPGTRTGLYVMVKLLPIETSFESTWPENAFVLFIVARQGV